MGTTHHDGLSVYGSGLWKGTKGIGTSGDVPFFGGVAGTANMAVRCDGGLIGVSGKLVGMSTRLSSIYYAVATLGSLPTSGLTNVVAIASGNCIDIDTIYNLASGAISVASISTPVNWFAAGT